MDEIREAGFSAFEMELFAGNREYVEGWSLVIQKSRDIDLKIPSFMAVIDIMFLLDKKNRNSR